MPHTPRSLLARTYRIARRPASTLATAGVALAFTVAPSGVSDADALGCEATVPPPATPSSAPSETPAPSRPTASSAPTTPAAPSASPSTSADPGPTAEASPTVEPSEPATSEAAPTTEPAPTTPAAPAPAPGRFPDASTTGAGATSGSRPGLTVTEPGTVVADTVINGQLTVRADDVTIRNVVIRTDDNYGLLTYGKNTVIEDSTIVGTPGQTVSGVLSYDSGQVTARRIDVSRSEDGVRLNDDSVLEDSYVHDLAGTAASHYDGVTADGFTGWRIEGNTILNHHTQTAAVWIGDRRYGASEGVLKDNLLAGGGYVIYAGPGGGDGLRVVGNVISTRFFPEGGYYGAVYWWNPLNNFWASNTWGDGPRLSSLIGPSD